MTTKKRVWLTVVLIISLFALIIGIANLIHCHIEISGYKVNYPPDFFWTKVLRRNIIFLYIMILVLFLNISFCIYIIGCNFNNKRLLFLSSKEEREETKKELKKKRLEDKLKKLQEK